MLNHPIVEIASPPSHQPRYQASAVQPVFLSRASQFFWRVSLRDSELLTAREQLNIPAARAMRTPHTSSTATVRRATTKHRPPAVLSNRASVVGSAASTSIPQLDHSGVGHFLRGCRCQDLQITQRAIELLRDTQDSEAIWPDSIRTLAVSDQALQAVRHARTAMKYEKRPQLAGRAYVTAWVPLVL